MVVDGSGKLDYKPAHLRRPHGRPIIFGMPAASFRGTQTGKRDQMANTSSAKKATRKIARRTAVNKNRRSRVRTFVRRVEEALEAGDKAAALTAFAAAQPELMRAASKGVVHPNTASRKVSRLAQRLKTLTA